MYSARQDVFRACIPRGAHGGRMRFCWGDLLVIVILIRPSPLVGLIPLLGHKHIQTRRTFQCEATGNVKEPASIRGRTLAVSLRYVQGDRRRDPVQLVICRQTFWKCFQEASSPSHKSNRLLINAWFLVIEVRFHGCCLLWRKPSTHAQDEDRARWGLGLGLGDIGTSRTAMRPRLPFRG